MRFTYQASGQNYDVDLEKIEGGYRVLVSDGVHTVEVNSFSAGALNLLVDGKTTKAVVVGEGNRRFIWLDGKSYTIEKPSGSGRRTGIVEAGGSGILRAPMPGQVRQVLVSEADKVQNGQTLLLLEAMKMEIRIQATMDGVVKQLKASEGETVDKDAILVEIEED